MAEDNNENVAAVGDDGTNKPENVTTKQSSATSEDEAEIKEQEEVDEAMAEIAKFVDQFNDKDSKDEQKSEFSKEKTPMDEDPESNHSFRLVLEDSDDCRSLKIDDKDDEEDNEEDNVDKVEEKIVDDKEGKEEEEVVREGEEEQEKEEEEEVEVGQDTVLDNLKEGEQKLSKTNDEDKKERKVDEIYTDSSKTKINKDKEEEDVSSKAKPAISKEKSEEKVIEKVEEIINEKVEEKIKEKVVEKVKEKVVEKIKENVAQEKVKENIEVKIKDKVEFKIKEKKIIEKVEDKTEIKSPLEKIIIKINLKSDDAKIIDCSTKKVSEKPFEKKSEEKCVLKVPEVTFSKEMPKKREETESEVGIVGPPAAASEVLSEAELLTEQSSLPTDETKAAAVVMDRVVQWVEKTASKADDPVPLEEEEEQNDGEDGEEEEKDADEEEEEDNKAEPGKQRKPDNDGTNGTEGPTIPRKAQKVVTNIIRRSIRCLNKMHAMDNSGGNVKKVESELKLEDDDSRKSPKVPQSQQNGAALPEETASADRNILRMPTLKREKDFSTTNAEDSQVIMTKSSKPQMNNQSTLMSKANRSTGQRGRPSLQSQMQLQQREEQQSVARESRKRRSAELLTSGSANGNSFASKRICLDQREQYINSLIGSDKITVEQLATKAEQLRSELQDLDELARAKEMEWNEILSLRKLKEEAFLRVERRRQVLGFMEGNGPLGHSESNLLPTSSLVLAQHGYEPRDRALLVPKEEQRAGSVSRDGSPALRRERASKTPTNFQQQAVGKLLENGPRHLIDAMSSDQRQIGEGRQGPIVDVRSIIADYRLRHPDTVPKRRGRRMRNSVVANVGLGAGGAMVETLGHMDSRPSSADSCKSSSNMNDPNNSMSFKDVLVQFAKLSQQQGEPIKTPQNYPDVTLHPVAPTQTTQNSSPQTGSLLHGILTKSQSPRPTNFSPTLARLLTAPERERNTPAITANPHQSAQQLLQAYQSSNSVSISDFLCSSKARTEITITPVVNSQVQSQSGNLIQIDDQDDDNSIIEERESRLSVGTNREEKDPPRCQGCNERAAQFVCAGCGAQWYCSRECQVAAWDDHSDNCSG